MEISLIWNVIFICALSQSIFLCTILLAQHFKSGLRSQLILSIFTLVFSYILFHNLMYWNQNLADFPHLLFSTNGLRFTLAPLFYYYCKSFFRPLQAKDSIHLIPFVLVTILTLPLLILSGEEKLALVSKTISDEYSILSLIINYSFSIQLIAYPVFIIFMLSKMVKRGHYERGGKINWLTSLSVLFLVYGVFMLSYFLLVNLNIGGIQKDFYISLVLCIAIYCIAYVGMLNPDLLGDIPILDNVKYKRTRLKESQRTTTVHELVRLMEEENLYLNPDLSLDDIAKKLTVPRHYISQALSLELNQTYHQFINSYRIKYACQLLLKLPKNENIKTVMYQCGFNNRASFNNNFKKITGMTATEYMTSR